jgi:hypothetical protein
MREIEPGWNEIVRVTWLLLWRAVAGGFVMSFLLGLIVNSAALFVLGRILGTQANLVIGVAVALIWWPQVVRMALKKRFRGFRLALIATDA